MLASAEREGRDAGQSAAPATLRDNIKWIRSILVVDDNALDADRTVSLLRVVCGYDVAIASARTVAKALAEVRQAMPDVVLLDDILSRTDRAEVTIPMLRRMQYAGPIVVITGFVTRERWRELIDLGALAALCKDDIDGNSLRQLLSATIGRGAAVRATSLPPEPPITGRGAVRRCA